MKKNEFDLNEKISSLQREIDRLNGIIKQLTDRNNLLEADINRFNEESKKFRD